MLISDSPRGSFKLIKQNAVKQGLSNILGVSGAVAVIVNFNLDAYDDNPVAFHKSLYSGFKSPATEILEKSIIKELYGQMGERFEFTSAFDFAATLNSAKDLFNIKKVQY
jgi:hypothetical protein